MKRRPGADAPDLAPVSSSTGTGCGEPEPRPSTAAEKLPVGTKLEHLLVRALANLRGSYELAAEVLENYDPIDLSLNCLITRNSEPVIGSLEASES